MPTLHPGELTLPTAPELRGRLCPQTEKTAIQTLKETRSVHFWHQTENDQDDEKLQLEQVSRPDGYGDLVVAGASGPTAVKLGS